MADLAYYRRKAAEIREIAAGLYDPLERAVVLEFVADLERLAAENNTNHEPLPKT
jgi:hypothetical protein